MDQEEDIPAKQPKLDLNLPAAVCAEDLLTARCVQQIRGHCSNERYSSNRPLNVTILAPRWWPWSGSDFSLLPRELAKQLAKFSDVKVTYLVAENSCSEWEKGAAVRHGVTIVEANEQPGFDDPIEWLSFPPEGLSTDIVVGVGKKLSKMAPIFKKAHRHCQSIFIASDPYQELCLELTQLSDRMDKKEKQKSQLRDKRNVLVDIPVGDLSVAIGPKMYDEHCQSQKTRVFKLTPGILSDFADITHDTSERTKFKMLLMGGDDPEYFDCEGLDIVAKAVAQLNDRSYELVYVGAAEYGDERFVKTFCQYGVNKNQLRIQSLPEHEEELKKWFGEADLVIMPSSEQKFGMMGLAALSSGLPVLVHGDSGLGEALKAVNYKFPDPATVDSEDAAEWAKKIKKLQKIGRKVRLEQASQLHLFYNEKYSWEKQCGALIKEMFSMVFASQEVKMLQGKEFAFKSEDQGVDESEEEVEVDSEDEKDTTELQDGKKTVIRRGNIRGEEDTWHLEKAAASVRFCNGTVRKRLPVTCSLWNPRTLSPTISSNEVLVSNVIELSHGGPPDLEFSESAKGGVTVALLHSASNLKGYEVVIKQLVNPENNEWKELETKNVWHVSENPRAPSWLFPFAQAACTVTTYSSFTAIWRPKAFAFSRSNAVGPEITCIVPSYPDVSVQIPQSCVPVDQDFCLTIKVQEFPSSELKGEGVIFGPVLDILGSQNVVCIEPITIRIPLTLREGKRELAELISGHVRILNRESQDESRDWNDVTDELEEPPILKDGTVQFKIRHFSEVWPIKWLRSLPSASDLKALTAKRSSRFRPQYARFLACLCKTSVPGKFGLKVYCYPRTLQHLVDKDLSDCVVPYKGKSNSLEAVCNGDKIVVSLSEAIIPQDTDLENAFVEFRGDDYSDVSGEVCIAGESAPVVKFFKIEECERRREHLCKVTILSTYVETPPSGVVLPSSGALRETQRVEELTQSNSITLSSEEGDSIDVPKKQLQVTLLATEWLSTKGGLSTINRELAKQLSANPKVKVTLFAPPFECSEEDKQMASDHGVTVVEAKRVPGLSDTLDWLSFPPQDLIIDVIIGHGVKLGLHAEAIRRSHHCKWVQMVHTSPEQLAMYKTYSRAFSRGEKKNQSEVALCEKADLVVAVGPKLKEYIAHSLRHCEEEKTVLSMIPSTFSEFYCVKTADVDTEKFYILAFGRCDPKDLSLKGYDIAAKALAELRDRSFHLTIIGANDGEQNELVKTLVSNGISRCQLTVRTFCKDRKSLAKCFSQFDLVVMPSRTEGFGLTALEALSAGLPILVSGNSGFAEALKKVSFGDLFIVEDFEDAKAWVKKIRAVQQKDRAQRLQEIEQLRKFYEEKYNWEKQCDDLVASMSSMVYAERQLLSSPKMEEEVNTNWNVLIIIAVAIGFLAVFTYVVLSRGYS